MKFKSVRFELDGKEFGEEAAGADVHLFADGNMNGSLHYKTAEVKFSQASMNDLDFLATMIVFIVERMSEERLKHL